MVIILILQYENFQGTLKKEVKRISNQEVFVEISFLKKVIVLLKMKYNSVCMRA